uniref:LysM peptidoglycan-binding domain-containing protein n=1 Tax=Roseivirga sp. TaxID=1964215 RepID=UPI0040480FBC
MRKRIYWSILLLIALCTTAKAQVIDTLAESPAPVYDYAPDFSYEELQTRYDKLELEIDIAFNDQVKAFINYFTVRNRDYTREMIRRKEVYFPIFEKYLAKYGLPAELKYLPIIEAGLNPKAVSGPKAVGLWQFMAPTAKQQGLKIDWYVDERMDPEKSTEAACKYIKWLHGILGDWKMTLAAYNSGIGNVQRAMKRSKKNDFWEVYRYLPRETRSYVPQFAAILYAMEYADEHNLSVDQQLYPIDFEEIEVNQFVYFKAFAEESGIALATLEQLNPAVKKGAIPANLKNYKMRIPRDGVENYEMNKLTILAKAEEGRKEFEKLVSNVPGSTFGKEKVTYRVVSGDVLGTIARKHNVRIEDLRAWNDIKGTIIRVGQKLDIWTGPDFLTDNTLVVQKVSNQNIPNTKQHTVQQGDTLWDISRMYKGLTIEKIKQLNNLKSNSLKPGMTLRIG